MALGHQAGALLIGSDLSFDRLVELQSEARQLAAESGNDLPARAFVFLTHQGYESLFFDVEGGDDPQVHRHEEAKPSRPLGMSFSVWFSKAADDEIGIRRSSRASGPKATSILRVLALLRLADRGWVEADSWDGDLCAIGIARSGDPRKLVYISTWKKGPGRYYFECEIPTGPDPTDYEVVAQGNDVDFETLLAAMERHLGRPNP